MFFQEATTDSNYYIIVNIILENVVDIQMTCEGFYFKLADGQLLGFDHNNKATCSF